VSAATVGLGLVGRRALAGGRAAESFHEWREISRGVWAVLGRTGDNMQLVGGNSVLVTSSDGGVLIDTKQAVTAPALRREVAERAPKLSRVVNTHHHFDHAGGNAAFSGGATVVTHAACAGRLKSARESFLAQFEEKATALAQSGVEGASQAATDARAWFADLAKVPANAFEPNETHTADFKVEVAGRVLHVKHFGPGHTDNDLVVHLAAENVVVTGDLVFHGFHPYFDTSGGATSAGWIESLRAIQKLCDSKTVVVPGHGAVSDRGAVSRQIEYFEKVRAAVGNAIKDGKTRDEVAKMTLPGYDAYLLKPVQPYLWGGIFDEMNAAKPAAAPKPAGA